MEEDRRIRLPLELGHDGVGEAAVHREIALRPGLVEPLVDVRRVDESPEVVLGEPENGVRDDVVVEVVGLRFVGYEAKAVRGAVAGDLVDRLASRLRGDEAVLGGHRARHPRDVVVGDEAPQGRHEAASAPARASRVVRFT